MANHSVIIEVKGKASYPVFRNLSEKDAISISEELNRLMADAGKATGKVINHVYRVILRK